MTSPPKISGYDVLRPLGGGPLTCVFAAREWRTDVMVALKVLRSDARDRETALELLRREARVGLAVRHPHLVRVRRAHVLREPNHIVMDLLPGESLRRRLRRDYRLDVPTALWVARQAAEALAALHVAGFVHGDVKPDNVHLVDDGTAVLIDLGFAHRPGENDELMRRGFVLGTANYLAPELCVGDTDGGPAADVFSLGLTLFEALTGRLPYAAGSVRETLRRHAADPPSEARRLLAAMPPALARLVDRLLERRPGDRPRAAAVVQQLVALEVAEMARRRAA